MATVSAGILLYREVDSGLEVFIAHMGGPFWAKKNGRAWSVPKGLQAPGDEDSLRTARREFREEIGVQAPDLDYVLLGDFRQKSGKVVRVFAANAPDFTIDTVRSNTFSLEWPPRSGRTQTFAEIDDAAWVSLSDAALRLVEGQVPVLSALQSRLAGTTV